VQPATSICHGAKTRTGANVHEAKQLQRDVSLLFFFLHKISWITTFGRKMSGCSLQFFTKQNI
jgi:hypothetical protein